MIQKITERKINSIIVYEKKLKLNEKQEEIFLI